MCMNIRRADSRPGPHARGAGRDRAHRRDLGAEGRGPFLFGGFGAADAMYAPVVLRFRTYAVDLPPACRAYADRVLALPALQQWMHDAESETETLPQFELYT